MNIIKEEIIINTNKQSELINITSQINEIIRKNKVQEGLINISTKHTTSAIIIINEDEEGLKKDILNFFEELIPQKIIFMTK